eukprot:jgi/Mesvir1/17439/Mv08717-RA.1
MDQLRAARAALEAEVRARADEVAERLRSAEAFKIMLLQKGLEELARDVDAIQQAVADASSQAASQPPADFLLAYPHLSHVCTRLATKASRPTLELPAEDLGSDLLLPLAQLLQRYRQPAQQPQASTCGHDGQPVDGRSIPPPEHAPKMPAGGNPGSLHPSTSSLPTHSALADDGMPSHHQQGGQPRLPVDTGSTNVGHPHPPSVAAAGGSHETDASLGAQLLEVKDKMIWALVEERAALHWQLRAATAAATSQHGPTLALWQSALQGLCQRVGVPLQDALDTAAARMEQWGAVQGGTQAAQGVPAYLGEDRGWGGRGAVAGGSRAPTAIGEGTPPTVAGMPSDASGLPSPSGAPRGHTSGAMARPVGNVPAGDSRQASGHAGGAAGQAPGQGAARLDTAPSGHGGGPAEWAGIRTQAHDGWRGVEAYPASLMPIPPGRPPAPAGTVRNRDIAGSVPIVVPQGGSSQNRPGQTFSASEGDEDPLVVTARFLSRATGVASQAAASSNSSSNTGGREAGRVQALSLRGGVPGVQAFWGW